ncbi:MAG: hypothetical protein Q8N60_01710 [Candidatus Diapherotrites archaeon]|nr:hypothetical protein [Candidatus Diapherotrites archaeon]
MEQGRVWISSLIALSLLFLFLILVAFAQGDDFFPPAISFVGPTPANGAVTGNTAIDIKADIFEENLGEVIYNWNGTNYPVYSDKLALFFNFNNVPALGEGAEWHSTVKDLSQYNNNGYLGNTTIADQVPVWESNGKYGGAFNFETPDFTTGDSILVYHSNSLNPDGNDFAMLFWFKCDYCLDTDIARKGCTETHAGGGWYKM